MRRLPAEPPGTAILKAGAEGPAICRHMALNERAHEDTLFSESAVERRQRLAKSPVIDNSFVTRNMTRELARRLSRIMTCVLPDHLSRTDAKPGSAPATNLTTRQRRLAPNVNIRK